MPNGLNKAQLPSKICVVCGRSFDWRKKWEECWQDVRYCSDRCRSMRQAQPKPPSQIQ
ncbi:MAG: DUF2256 domain-containing protein [Luteolibacter sp.]